MPTPFTIADAAVAVGADFKKFDAEVKRKEQETTSRLGRFAAALKRDFGTVLAAGVGTAAGTAFGAVTTGAVQAGDAMALLAARTGKSRDELAGYEDRMRSLHSQNFGRDFRDLADAISQVESGLGLVGDEADDVVKKAIAIRDTWGREITETVRATRPLMENFGISASRALDIITVGMQRGGDNADDLLDTLQEYSPFMKRLGIDAETFLAILLDGLEDGVRNTDYLGDALKEFSIRLFDNSTLTREALAALGINYDLLIAQIDSGAITGADAMGMINDALRGVGNTAKREELGVALYGTKWEDVSGEIILGMTEVGDTVENVAGQVEGAGDRMVDAIYSGPTAAVEAFVRSAFGKLNELLGFAEPVINAFTPLAVLFGPQLTAKLSAGLGAITGLLSKYASGAALKAVGAKIAGVLFGSLASGIVVDSVASGLDAVPKAGKVKDAMNRLGRFMGSGLGTAFGLAFAAVAVLAVIETYLRIRAEHDAQLAEINKDVDTQIAKGTAEQLEQSKAALEHGLEEINKVWDAGIFTTDARRGLEAELAAVNAELERRAAGLPRTVADGLEEGADDVAGGARLMTGAAAAALAGLAVAAREAGKLTPQELADGITAARNKPLDAIDRLIEMLKNPLSRTREVARLMGQLTSKELAEGLASSDPAIRAQATAAKDYILERLREMKVRTGILSKGAAADLAAGLNSKDPEIRAAAQEIYDLVYNQVGTLPAKAYAWGSSMGRQYGAGITSQAQYVQRAAAGLATVVGSNLRVRSPAKEGPLSEGGGPEGWGERMGALWSQGLRASVHSVSQMLARALGPVPGGLTLAGGSGLQIPGELVSMAPQGEIVPRGTGGVLGTAEQALAGGLPSGNTYNIEVNNPEPRAAEQDIGRMLRRLEGLGV